MFTSIVIHSRYLDLGNVFDIVPHSKFLITLNSYGIAGAFCKCQIT